MALSNTRGSVFGSHGEHEAGRFVPRSSPRAWLDGLARFGLVVRGIIYFVPGALALEWSFGRHRQPMNPTSVIDLIGQQPLGRVLLVLLAVGFAGYAAWGVKRAIFDPLRRGHSPAGIALRIGYATSAIAYLGLLFATVGLLTGDAHSTQLRQDWSVSVLAHPFGGVLVAAIGLCWIFGSGLAQIVMGWRKSFERDLLLERMGRLERRWAVGLGRAGLVSRGIVFTIIGVMLVASALHPQARSSMGLEGALLQLAHQPFGRTLLGAAAVGLLAFGAFSAMCARWMRMRPPAYTPGATSTLSPPS